MKAKTYLIVLTSMITLSSLMFQACKKEESNNSPNCIITSPSDGEDCMQGDIVTVSVTSSDSDGNIAFVDFFIDKVKVASVGNSPYKYDWNTSGESLGNHTIKVTSVDNGGASSSDEVTINIIEGQGVDFTADPTTGDIPLTVTFTDQSNNNPVSWEWDFGDGNSSAEQSPVHTYNEIGAYDVKLATINGSGTDTETKSNFIIAKGVFTDTRDNKEYRIVEIGEQVWFAENLNYESPDSWWHMNEESNGDIYGRLYTWDAAMMACPGGWHLPSDEEWKTLEMFLGMSQSEADANQMRGTDEGKKLKSISGWNSGTGTDVFGFATLPGGERDKNGNFLYKGDFTALWTATPHSEYETAWYRYFDGGEDRVGREDYNKLWGYSVRCIKND